ncbi:estradiol 17-beta-dehydrogenase 11-like isoform 2-T2 [Amazona ochrocephala]
MNLFAEILLFVVTLIYSYLEAFVKLFVPVKRKSVSGELVLITGAGHGVGRATAFEFAKRQSRLVLWDISKHSVEETAAECKRLGATVQAFVVDCSKREEIYSAAEKVKQEIGDVSILVNNAGVITAADFLSTQDHQIERMFEVNILAHMWTTKAFLPTMMKNNHGHIVTAASAAGHLVTSFMVAYWLGKILEIEEVVEALMEGILTNRKMVFVPPHLNIALLSEMLLPERALAVLKKLTNVKFDAVIGQKSTQ